MVTYPTAQPLRVKDYRGVAAVQHRRGALVEGNLSAGGFLRGGIDRWEREGRLGATEAEALRDHLSSGAVQDALRHLGVHMALSAPIPVPGLQNLARLVWTAAFWAVFHAVSPQRCLLEHPQALQSDEGLRDTPAVDSLILASPLS